MFLKSLLMLATAMILPLSLSAANTTGHVIGQLEHTKVYSLKDSNGNSISGNGNGFFNAPTSIVHLSDGSFWVVEYGNHRIQHFSKVGTFLGKVGAVNSSLTPVSGTGNSEFTYPRFIAKDSSDNIYVTEATQIKKFSSDGTYISTIQNDLFEDLWGIAADSSNNIWVVDNDKHHVFKVDQNATVLDGIGYESAGTYFYGTADGQLRNPVDIEIDSDGSLWVADYYNKRVQHFDSSGTFLAKIDLRDYVRGIAVDSTSIWATFDSTDQIYKYNKSTLALEGVFDLSTYDDIYDIDIVDNIIWLVDYNNNEVIRAVRNGTKEFTKVANYGKLNTSDTMITTYDDENGFVYPNMVVVDGDDNVWVHNDRSIKKYDQSGSYVFGLGTKSNNSFTYYSFADYSSHMSIRNEQVVVLSHDYSYYDTSSTNDTSKSYIITLNSDGSLDNEIEIAYSDNSPVGFVTNDDGTAFIASNYGIYKVATDGTLSKWKGLVNASNVFTAGSGDNQFDRISDMRRDQAGNIYVLDSHENKIKVYDLSGGFLKSVSTYSDASKIAIDNHGNIYEYNGSYIITKRDSDGTYLTQMQFNANYEEGFNLSSASQPVYFDSNNNMWMADYYNHRISKYIEGSYNPSVSAPVVSMSINIEEGKSVTVYADAYDEDGDIASYDWDFGDSTTHATNASTSHVYASVGTYTVKLTVTDDDGNPTSLEQVVKITGTGSTVISSTGQGCSAATFSYTQNDIDQAIDEQKTACQLNPSSCSIVDGTGVAAIHQDCQNDPASCGITNTVDMLTSSDIASLTNGWHLLGSSVSIDDLSIFNNAHSVWYYQNSRWQVYTFDPSLKQAVTDSSIIDTLNNLNPNSGFWIMR